MPSSVVARGRSWLAANPNITQTILAYMIKIGGAGLSFALNLMLARTFGPVGVGAFGLMVTTLTLASTVALVGLDYVLIRVIAGDLKEGATALARGAAHVAARFVAVNSIVVAVVTALLVTPLIVRFTGDADSVVALRAAAWGVVPITLIRVVSATLRASGRIQLGQILDGPASTGLSMLALAAWLWFGHPDVGDAARLYVGAIAISVAWGGYVSWRYMRAWGPAERVPLSPMVRGGWKILIVVLTSYSTDWLILTGIARYASTAEVGLFRTAWQIASLFNLLVVAFDAVGGPRIAAAWRVGDRAALVHTARQSSLVMVGLSAPLLLLCLAAPEWLLGWFGPRFIDAATALRILAVGQLVNMATGPIGSILIMTGHERYSMVFAIVAVIAAAILLPLLTPALGITGAAIVSASVLSFRKFAALFLVYRIIRPASSAS